MRENLLKLVLAVFLCVSGSVYSSPRGDMEFLGYSEELMTETMSAITHNEGEDYLAPADPIEQPQELDEATSLQVQLVELAKTRAIRADLSDRSLEIKTKVDGFWDKMNPKDESIIATDALRAQVLAGMREALTLSGYTVIQLELIDLPDGSIKDKFRAIVRATRPLKTKNSYVEIQKSLREIKGICAQAATIEGTNYLSELTTFVAENPKNKYYYEKTILTY